MVMVGLGSAPQAIIERRASSEAQLTRPFWGSVVAAYERGDFRLGRQNALSTPDHKERADARGPGKPQPTFFIGRLLL